MQGALPFSTRFRHVVVPRAANVRPRTAPVVRDSVAPLLPSARPSASPNDDEEIAFCRWLLDRAGLPAGAYRVETLKRRVPACLRALRARRVQEARRTLEQAPLLLPLALGSMLVGVTSFFRDRAVFDVLERELALLVKRRGGLHVWSAACSDGQELYSIGLLLAELGALGQSYLLGTDCRASALSHARHGRYSEQDVKSVPQPLLTRYFNEQSGHYQIAPELVQSARFRVADLLGVQEPGHWDVISCRNLIMYLNPSVGSVARLWERFETALRPGGLLILGKAERPTQAKRLSFVAPCIYRRVRG